LIAIDKEGKILWRESRSVPEIASPIFYNGRVYMVTNGGIVTCVNAEDGKLVYRERLGAAGPYFASPVAANGHIYFASSEGVVTVVKDNADKLQVVARRNFAEPIYGTPAISGDRLYIRTTQRLYAFGQ
jgi:outer membrane protein assembly factor BamB